MAKPRAWTFTTEDGDAMLSDTYPLPDLVRDFECDAPIRATTLRGYHTGLRLFLEWLRAKNNIERPTLADLTPENAAAFAIQKERLLALEICGPLPAPVRSLEAEIVAEGALGLLVERDEAIGSSLGL